MIEALPEREKIRLSREAIREQSALLQIGKRLCGLNRKLHGRTHCRTTSRATQSRRCYCMPLVKRGLGYHIHYPDRELDHR